MATPQAEIDRYATIIYNYHRMSMPLRPATAIFCLCSLDTRVAHHAAELYLTGLGTYLIFSGGTGKLTASRFTAPEATVFASIALSMGVPPSRIITESQSTNTGENVRFTRSLLEERGLMQEMESFILVQKPYMERRTYGTFCKQWGEPRPEFMVTSPGLEFGEYFDEENPKEFVVGVMVGDLVRIREYPKRGFQIEMEIPEEVWEAGQRLIGAGFDGHLP